MERSWFELRIDGNEGADRLKLVWTEHTPQDEWPALPYHVSRPALNLASETVREVLRRLPTDFASLSPDEYQSLLQNLANRGAALADNIFNAVDGNSATADEVRQLLLKASGPGHGRAERSELRIILGDESVYVPWGFVFQGDPTELPAVKSRPIEDFDDFWLGSFRLTTRFQGPSRLQPGKQSACSVYAIHEDLFTEARSALQSRYPDIEARLLQLLSEAKWGTNWTECQKIWRSVREDYDSVLYVFGHSDGERINLSEAEGECDYVLPASSFKTVFGKSKTTRSNSICILNGCCTAVPNADRAWPAGFLTATQSYGFLGFIGTETPVRNDLATIYGVELLWRLCSEGQTVGEAFDALQEDPELFPLSLVYSCFANRNFRLRAARATPPEPTAAEVMHAA